MRDLHLPAAEQLLGPQAHDVLAPAVAGAGGRLLSARATQVRYQPGQRLVVRYGADVVWADGSQRRETLGALVQRGDLPDELSVVEGPDAARVGVWRYPHDPFLPGLPQVAYPDGARRVLAHLGLPVDEVTVEPVVYRPTSRAVLRLRAGGTVHYVKVVRPGTAQRIRDLHAAFLLHLPVPRCLGWSDVLGIVVLQALPGAPLTRALVDGGSLPAAQEVAAMLHALRRVDLPRRPAARVAQAQDHGDLLRSALPHAGAQVGALVEQAGSAAAEDSAVVHGDFYEGQLLVVDGRLGGLLDIDGARRGGAHEDPATMIGHLLALAHVHPRAATRIDAYRGELTRAVAATTDPGVLQRAVLEVLLGLATTPFRRQEPDWPARTQGWLDLCSSWAQRTAAP